MQQIRPESLPDTCLKPWSEDQGLLQTLALSHKGSSFLECQMAAGERAASPSGSVLAAHALPLTLLSAKGMPHRGGELEQKCLTRDRL